MIPCLPSFFSMTELSVMGIRWPSSLAYPRLYINSLMAFKLGSLLG